ncbi:beta-Ala-His dipeptidase [Salinispira pacifica]
MSDYTAFVLDYFEKISAVPRCSGAEARIRNWLSAWAEEQRFASDRDAAGNILIRVPASAGNEACEPILLQAHMDMVCEKQPDSPHDFSRDPIRLVRDGDWVRAERTTLGADNGMGMALALAAASVEGATRPPLELLFTVDEETGLTGAKGLEPGYFSGSTLINIDSEDEGVFTVGCAGGRNTEIILHFTTEPVPAGLVPVTVKVSGLTGGHSGVDIHKVLGNANVILVRFLQRMTADEDVRIADIAGGSAHNAIPRDAAALLYLREDRKESIAAAAREFELSVKGELGGAEPSLSISVASGREELPPPTADTVAAAVAAGANRENGAGGAQHARRLFTVPEAQRLLELLHLVPHGVRSMSPDIPGFVQTSTNFATVGCAVEPDGERIVVSVLTSQRSSVASELEDIAAVLEDLARVGDGESRISSEYPAWQPDFGSPLLSRSREIYRRLFDADPVVEAVHAGLECGVIGSIRPGMDMISMGATIRGAHSPGERLFVPSIDRVLRFLLALIESYAVAPASSRSRE